MTPTFTLYHYDHCPYCVKARMIFGFKNLSLKLIPLLNDDEATPVKLIGKKMVPILIKEDQSAMPESLDIIKYIDENYGPTPLIQYTQPNLEISQWLQEARSYLYYLAMPRWIKMPLPEFETESSRNYFQEKKERQSIGSFTEAFNNTEHYKSLAEDSLKKLNSILEKTNGFVTNKPIHIDDIHLFASLRSLTCVKDLKWPDPVLKYVQNWAQRSKVDTFFEMAL